MTNHEPSSEPRTSLLLNCCKI